MTRLRTAVIGVALLASYAGVAISGLPERIARQDPALASYFRPPWFNFNATYTSGSVLNFRVGTDRTEFATALKNQYGGTGMLLATCGTGALFGTARDFVAVADITRAPPLLAKDLVCVNFENRRILLLVTFSSEKVKTIQLACIHREGT